MLGVLAVSEGEAPREVAQVRAMPARGRSVWLDEQKLAGEEGFEPSIS
jgi:hypothetical protein